MANSSFYFDPPKPETPQAADMKDMDIWIAARSGYDWTEPHWIEAVNSDGKEGRRVLHATGLCTSSLTAIVEAARTQSTGLACSTGNFSNRRCYPPQLMPDRQTRAPSLRRIEILCSSTPLVQAASVKRTYTLQRGEMTLGAAYNLGPAVNSPNRNYNPAILPDGRQFFFGRNGRIYVIATSAIADLDPQSLW